MPGFDDIDRLYRPPGIRQTVSEPVRPELPRETLSAFYERRGWPDADRCAAYQQEARRVERHRLLQLQDRLRFVGDYEERCRIQDAYYALMKADRDMIAQRYGFYGETWGDKG